MRRLRRSIQWLRRYGGPIFVLLSLICGVLNYGLFLAWEQRQWPHRALEDCPHDQQRAALMALRGVPGFLHLLLLAEPFRYHGLLFRCLTPAEVGWRGTPERWL